MIQCFYLKIKRCNSKGRQFGDNTFFSSVQKVFIANPHIEKTYNGQTYTVIVTALNELNNWL